MDASEAQKYIQSVRLNYKYMTPKIASLLRKAEMEIMKQNNMALREFTERRLGKDV